MKIVLIGGTSGIGRALAHEFLARGDELLLTGRSAEEVERVTADLRVRHGQRDPVVHGAVFDVMDLPQRRALIDRAVGCLGGLDGIMVTVGEIGDRALARSDADYARTIQEINYQAPADLLDAAANYFEAHPGEGRFLAAVGSVAGDRGRQSNYHYGSSKAALHAHLQGLRHRMHAAGTHVLTIKPGLIDTPMVFGRDDLIFLVSAERAARDIVSALEGGTNELYTPWFWRWIMLAIRVMPEFLFRRMKV